MFDPVTDQVRRIHLSINRAVIQEKRSACSKCGEKVDDLYNGRCITCQVKIEEGIFHHKIPDSGVEIKKPFKKIDQPKKKG